jgi:hypothetical protein
MIAPPYIRGVRERCEQETAPVLTEEAVQRAADERVRFWEKDADDGWLLDWGPTTIEIDCPGVALENIPARVAWASHGIDFWLIHRPCQTPDVALYDLEER